MISSECISRETTTTKIWNIIESSLTLTFKERYIEHYTTRIRMKIKRDTENKLAEIIFSLTALAWLLKNRRIQSWA